MTILYRRICTTSYQKINQKENYTKNQKVNDNIFCIILLMAWIYNKRDKCIPKMLQRVADRTLC